ncbi:MAG TPA: hypothetical protein VKZ63_04940 [Kofleriaceae bacterium]|nr:hypothetical protein [Kofleriaceae bacterium]
MSSALHPARTRMILAGLAAACLIAALAAPAEAQRRQSPRAASFEANKTFGLGIMIGAPTGLSGKYYLSSSTAIDFALGVYHEFRYDDALQVHADFLWHPATLAAADPFLLALYFGVGGRLLDHDEGRDYRDDTHLGVRVPVGLLMDFNTVPLDIFFELALVADILVDTDHHDHVDFDGAIGVRYYF